MAKQTLKAAQAALVKVDAKAVRARLPKGVEERLVAEMPAHELHALIEAASGMFIDDAGRAAIRLMQLSGRVPTEAQVVEMIGEK